jgi:hypothetical protein
MGFRLSSAIAGFAERTSENLTALQDKADEITKTAAERYANEALQVRKERIKSVREYTRAAKELQRMGLDNAQIEVALSAGVAGVENVKSSLANLATREKLKDPSFEGFNTLEERKGAINSLFTGLPEDATGRDIAEQAKIFASFESPMVAPDAKALGEQVAAATKTLFSPEGIDPEYTTAQFTAQAEAAGGKAPVDVEGDLGIAGATMQTVADPVAFINALQVQQNLTRGGIEIESLKMDNKFKQFSNPLLLKELRQKLEIGEIQKGNLQVEGLLNKARLASENIDLHLKRKFGTKKYEAELESLAAQTAKTVAETGRPTSYEDFIVGMQWELSQIDAEKDPEKVALLKTKINEANINYQAFELVGEDGDIDLTGLGSMQKLLGQIVTNKSAGKFVMGTDFLISETGDIIWKGEKEGQDAFNQIKREASKDFVDALAPNGQFVNEGARIAVTGLAGNMYKLMYPTEAELSSMVNTEFRDPESGLNTGESSLDDVINFVLQKLKVRNPDATLEDAKKLVSEAR